VKPLVAVTLKRREAVLTPDKGGHGVTRSAPPEKTQVRARRVGLIQGGGQKQMGRTNETHDKTAVPWCSTCETRNWWVHDPGPKGAHADSGGNGLVSGPVRKST